jgi:hypothetical protein
LVTVISCSVKSASGREEAEGRPVYGGREEEEEAEGAEEAEGRPVYGGREEGEEAEGRVGGGRVEATGTNLESFTEKNNKTPSFRSTEIIPRPEISIVVTKRSEFSEASGLFLFGVWRFMSAESFLAQWS